MAWAGTGLVWTMSGGVPTASAMSRSADGLISPGGDLVFAQISDSHIGFSKAANTDVTATLQMAVDRLNGLGQRPAFVLHTGDITQLAKASEFDTAEQVLRGVRTDGLFYVPGEHDVAGDAGALYLKRFGAKGSRGWYSFDHSGVHFVGLANVFEPGEGGLGALGRPQIEWLRRDLEPLSSSTPVVVFAHVPLWSLYPAWGWGTADSEQALALLRRFGSVTVLNGHIHQIMQKVEGNVAFHTALSTAFPQPAPGTAPAPGPMVVEAGQLGRFLGVRQVAFVPGRGSLATVDETLSGEPLGDFAQGADRAMDAGRQRGAQAANEVEIANFAFRPKVLGVSAGTTVTWINRDDTAHTIISPAGAFTASGVLDTGDRHSFRFTTPGEFDYRCGIHPVMTGRISVHAA